MPGSTSTHREGRYAWLDVYTQGGVIRRLARRLHTGRGQYAWLDVYTQGGGNTPGSTSTHREGDTPG